MLYSYHFNLSDEVSFTGGDNYLLLLPMTSSLAPPDLLSPKSSLSVDHSFSDCSPNYLLTAPSSPTLKTINLLLGQSEIVSLLLPAVPEVEKFSIGSL